MQKVKDKTQRTLESYNEVFADIVNVLLFDGKEVIKPDELTDATEISQFKVSGDIHSQERDVAKFWKDGLIQIALIGLENQTDPDPDMPLRIISYDGAAYKEQLIKRKKGKRFPVITLVLYFGYKREWGKVRSLRDRLNIPDELRDYVSDYKINLFEICKLNDETVAKFTSDFKVVADFCTQMYKNGRYIPSSGALVHPREVMDAMSAFIGDKRFEEVYNESVKRSGEEAITMKDTSVFDSIVEIGVKRGEELGLKRGEELGLKRGLKHGEAKLASLISELLKNGREDDIKKVATDSKYRNKLYSEFGL